MDKTFMNSFNYTVSFISPRIKKIIEELNEATIENIQEIRLRKNKPVVIVSNGESSFLTTNSKTTYIVSNNCVVPAENELVDTINKMCGYSMHTQTENISNGFITLKNGSRIGVSGTAVYEGKSIKSVKDINSINIRIPRNKLNISDSIFDYFQSQGIKNILIVGPPNCGKTTMLKDIAYQLSAGRLGKYYKVCIVDERNEISSSDFSGPNTDVLSGFQKDNGITIAMRTLSPDFIVCDEIGSVNEVLKIIDGMNSGIKFVLSLHSSDLSELKRKKVFNLLVDEADFDTVVLLSDLRKPGEITNIYKIERRENEICFCEHNFDNKLCCDLIFNKAN